MHTREDLRPAEAVSSEAGDGLLLAGLGRTTLVAVTALAGCLLLIAFGAAMSLCWMVHPLLFALAGAGIAWLVARVAPRLFRAPARNR
jgi:fatty acid desaturase